MHAEPQQEHLWLQKFVGEWAYESECNMGPGQPLSTFRGTESVRSLGGLWVLCEGRWETPGGGTTTTIMTLGYDPLKKKYVGTFIGSMMTNIWAYEGTLDPAGTTLPLDTEGPSFVGDGKMVKFKDVLEFKSDDHRVLTSHMQGENGEWSVFMTANYKRVK
mgnify:CR=1 FL=1